MKVDKPEGNEDMSEKVKVVDLEIYENMLRSSIALTKQIKLKSEKGADVTQEEADFANDFGAYVNEILSTTYKVEYEIFPLRAIYHTEIRAKDEESAIQRFLVENPRAKIRKIRCESDENEQQRTSKIKETKHPYTCEKCGNNVPSTLGGLCSNCFGY